MARRTPWAAEFGGRRSAPARDPGDWTTRLAGRSGGALRAAQAIPATELRGAGLSSGGFSLVSSLCPAAVVVVAEEVDAAQDDQRDQRGELGGHQSGCGVQRPPEQAGERHDGPHRQHRDAGADARAHRQLSAVGCGARDGASAEAGERPAWRALDHLAQSPPAGQEARPRYPIQYSRGKAQKAKLYRELIAATRATVRTLEHAVQRLAAGATIQAELWLGQVRHYLPLIERIITQAERRVLAGEAVPSGEKLVSLFETHADIIVKGSREVHYGHKLNLTTGKSGLILDVVVEAGNPADAERFLPMLERHIARQGTPPRQTASDGGYASLDNLKQAKALGVQDVAFHKKRALTIDAMVKSRWVYHKLKNFRAGIEANISCLKRAFGLARCTWRGLDHFKAYVWSSVVAYNLALLVRLKPA